jgi:hypothetical protein
MDDIWVKTESGQDPRVCWRLGEVTPWLGVGYVDTVSSSIARVGTARYLYRVYKPIRMVVSSV